jgi:hypothetical protein
MKLPRFEALFLNPTHLHVARTHLDISNRQGSHPLDNSSHGTHLVKVLLQSLEVSAAVTLKVKDKM